MEIGKTLGYFLRHHIGKINAADEYGYIGISDLQRIIKEKNGESPSIEEIQDYVENKDEKGRFFVKGNLIKACYGHSFEVKSELVEEKELPEKLYVAMHKSLVDKINQNKNIEAHKRSHYYFESKEKALKDKDVTKKVLFEIETTLLSDEFKKDFKFEDGVWKNPRLVPLKSLKMIQEKKSKKLKY